MSAIQNLERQHQDHPFARQHQGHPLADLVHSRRGWAARAAKPRIGGMTFGPGLFQKATTATVRAQGRLRKGILGKPLEAQMSKMPQALRNTSVNQQTGARARAVPTEAWSHQRQMASTQKTGTTKIVIATLPTPRTNHAGLLTCNRGWDVGRASASLAQRRVATRPRPCLAWRASAPVD